MGRFVEGQHRRQAAFPPECLEDYVDPDNPVRVINWVDAHSSTQRVANLWVRSAVVAKMSIVSGRH